MGIGRVKWAILAYTTPRDEDIAQNPMIQLSWNDLQQLQQHHSRLVCFTDHVAEHIWQPLALEFTPRPSEKYYLYMKAGNGGAGAGHLLLYLRDILVHTIFMDKPDRLISRNYRILSDLNVIGSNQSTAPFFLQLFRISVAFLRDRWQGDDAHLLGQDSLSQFIQSYGIVLDDSSLESVEELLAHNYEKQYSM